MIGPIEIGIILFAIVLFFSPHLVPRAANALGRARVEFKNAIDSNE